MELLVQVLFEMLVLESGSLGLVTVEGGDVRDDIGLPFSSLMPGDNDLQSACVGEPSA